MGAASCEASGAVQQALHALLFARRTASFVAVHAAISSLFFRLAESLMKIHFSVLFLISLCFRMSVSAGCHFRFSFFCGFTTFDFILLYRLFYMTLCIFRFFQTGHLITKV